MLEVVEFHRSPLILASIGFVIVLPQPLLQPAEFRGEAPDPRTPFVDESKRPDPHMSVYGADFRMIDNYLGNAAIAASYADAHYATLLTGMNFFGAYNGEQMTKPLLYAPLPAEIAAKAEQKIKAITYQGKPIRG